MSEAARGAKVSYRDFVLGSKGRVIMDKDGSMRRVTFLLMIRLKKAIRERGLE